MSLSRGVRMRGSGLRSGPPVDRSSRPIPGNTSANDWKGIHAMSDLVQIENPPCGWMQNCNCSPAAMMNHDQPPRTRYAEHPYLYNKSPSPDAHQRAEMVTDLLDAAVAVNAEQAIAIAFSTQVWHAERCAGRLGSSQPGITPRMRSREVTRPR